MTLAQEVRQAFIAWSESHTGWMIDSLISNFYTPKNGPQDVVMAVVNVSSELNVQGELEGLRRRVHRIADGAGIESVRIVVRTRDSRMIVGG